MSHIEPPNEAGSPTGRVPQSVFVTIGARAERCLCCIDRQSAPMARHVLLGVFEAMDLDPPNAILMDGISIPSALVVLR